MTKFLKVFYEERNTRLQGESSNPQKGDKSSRGYGGDGNKTPKGNGDKPPITPPLYSPPSSPPSSPSSSSTTSPSQSPPHSLKGHGKTLFLKLDINFDFPMYDGEVNAKRLYN